jgi:hypothetical protein
LEGAAALDTLYQLFSGMAKTILILANGGKKAEGACLNNINILV